MQPWRDEYLVRSYESDSSARLSPAFVLRYLQETAWNNARSLGFALDPRSGGRFVWVLSRLRLRMERYPAWGDLVTVETWPLGVERMLALRDFRLVDGRGRGCGAASSGWIIIDAAGRRPQRPEQALPELSSFAGPRPLLGVPLRIEGAAAPCLERELRVSTCDIDVNNHVNNARYLEWVLDSLSPGSTAGRRVGGLEASYLSEALVGETVVVRSVDEGSQSRHTIVAMDGHQGPREREVCRFQLAWLVDEKPLALDSTLHYS
jgi:acyl-ACP thioesterase